MFPRTFVVSILNCDNSSVVKRCYFKAENFKQALNVAYSFVEDVGESLIANHTIKVSVELCCNEEILSQDYVSTYSKEVIK